MKQGRYTIFYCGISLIYHGIYTYTDIIGESLDWSNIVIFFGVAGLVYLVETKCFWETKRAEFLRNMPLQCFVLSVLYSLYLPFIRQRFRSFRILSAKHMFFLL